MSPCTKTLGHCGDWSSWILLEILRPFGLCVFRAAEMDVEVLEISGSVSVDLP